ncbi:hypothetical protein RND81_04G069400 [Saponaria officinalis]|uniref:Neprosin PEP catalytic domain-containing protein n=1 Tax=Saponaria officinalis TaxID=3572 RepID=A0AAW1LJJ3_SAPOF
MKNILTQIKMSFTKFIILMLSYSFLIAHKTEGIRLTKVAEIDLDKQYQLLRKPSTKTIQTEYGDVYDCIDFYRQPAFDHPLLKNHTFYPEMRSTYTSNEDEKRCSDIMANVVLKDGGCPKGTVPIRRVSKEEFYKIHRFTNSYATSGIQPKPGTHYAVIQTNSNPSTVTYSGEGGTFNAYNISLEQSQYSAAEFLIQNDDDRIKAGWMVNPTVNKDNHARIFGYFDAGQSHCFNTLCPGFVAVRKDIYLGIPLTPLSVRGEMPYYFQMRIHQDIVNGNWWLNVCGEDIGFWPKQIFTTMSNTATLVAVGGEAYSPIDRPLPPMGNGYYPVQSMRLSAYCSHIVFVDGNHRIIDHPETARYTDDPHYGIIDAGVTNPFGRLIFFGGTAPAT